MDSLMMNLAQSGGAGGGLATLVWLAFLGFVVASMWKVFQKAGQPGWGVLVPFLNIYLLCKIAGRPGWWMLLFFVPFVNIAMLFVLGIDVAKAFGKSAGFGIGLALLGFVFYPILAFGSAEYRGPQSGGPRAFPVEDHAQAA